MANEIPIAVDQGSTFQFSVDIDSASVNLDSYDIFASFAKDHESSQKIYFSSNSVGNTVILTLAPSDTLGLDPGKYLYDVILVDTSNNVIRILEGQLILRPNITVIPTS